MLFFIGRESQRLDFFFSFCPGHILPTCRVEWVDQLPVAGVHVVSVTKYFEYHPSHTYPP